jgi:hypothetical protein
LRSYVSLFMLKKNITRVPRHSIAAILKVVILKILQRRKREKL